MELAITLMQFFIAAVAFAAMTAAVIYLHPRAAAVRAYRRVDNRLKEVKLFNYERMESFLKANGAAAHYGKWVTPTKFLILQVCSGGLLFAVGASLHMAVAVSLLILGIFLPSILLLRMNANDNHKMLPQLQSLYNNLQEQIKAGVYVTDALSESYRGMEHGRLRTALEQLAGELILRKSFAEAMEHFQESFDNPAIDSLCVILIQAQESGKTTELLADMSDQIKDMQVTALARKKEQLNRIETICIIGLLAVIVGIILYVCVISMVQTAGSL